MPRMIEAYRNDLLLACVTEEAAQGTRLHDGTSRITTELLEMAEAHSLSPLLYDVVKAQSLPCGEAELRVLRSLVLRHKRHAEARSEVLRNILHALAQPGVDVLVLKGAALAHTVYARPGLRPMSDIDLLVRKRDLEQARKILLGLGFRSTTAPSDFMSQHHHIPALVFPIHGTRVAVELHHDALSGDVGESITLDNLKEEPLEFSIGEVPAHTLGHLDNLHHLCRHSFEPGETVRLIHVADILRYASKFADHIDWQRIRTELPFIANTIRCLGYVTPLPTPLVRIVSAPPDMNVPGVGKVIKPLSKILEKPRELKTVFRELFMPSPWWLHVNYNIAPENSLLMCRLFSHPMRVLRWLGRRYRALVFSKRPAQRR